MMLQIRKSEDKIGQVCKCRDLKEVKTKAIIKESGHIDKAIVSLQHQTSDLTNFKSQIKLEIESEMNLI